VIENGVPIGERILMHWTSLPAPHAGNGRDEVGADASFNFHEVRIPSSFLDGSEAFVFFGGFAFGLRASLFERFCPLAILDTLDRLPAFGPSPEAFGARVEAGFQPLKQAGPGAPCLGAAFKGGANMSVCGR
jgi:hypothetical protein